MLLLEFLETGVKYRSAFFIRISLPFVEGDGIFFDPSPGKLENNTLFLYPPPVLQ